ncbi:MAG: S26 family signal peptidase [Muribaculaceae bacterium]|nr:S26 family signal peptidase [Muribaculaceae bacterium]
MSKDFKSDFHERISQVKTTRWVRFGIVGLIYLAWVAWLGSPWWALGLVLLFDIYITGYIPLTWWKKSKNKAVTGVMSWVDAIVYALVLVYFVFAFVGQNYQIPSSSLEKTLLTGDYLWVNKLMYGPRVPMTPVHFPLVHNKLPVLGCKSYLDSPSNEYRRLRGLRGVESGDIVVFNFPAGDTVCARYEESPEYYDLLVKRYGRETIRQNPEQFGEVIYRPVDRRQNFVKRAVGLPGERLRIVNDTIYIDGKAQAMPENVQFNYIAAVSRPIDEDRMHALGIAQGDVQALMAEGTDRMRLSAILPGAQANDFFYVMPMTQQMIAELRADGTLHDAVKFGDVFATDGAALNLFPEGLAEEWTLSNYGGEHGVLIPKKGMTVKMSPSAWKMYHRVIRNYEGHTNSWLADDGTVFIDGKPAQAYTFAMDYYFMMGDNRDNSQDSRFWGFVPEDHVVGTPMRVLISFDRDRSLLNGGIRWNRILKDANPDK